MIGGKAAEQVDVGHGQEPDRPSGLAREDAGQRQHEPPDEHQDLGDHEHLDVQPQALPHEGQEGLDRIPVEVLLSDRAVVGREEEGEEGEHQRTDADPAHVPRPVLGRRPGCSGRHPILGSQAGRLQRPADGQAAAGRQRDGDRRRQRCEHDGPDLRAVVPDPERVVEEEQREMR